MLLVAELILKHIDCARNVSRLSGTSQTAQMVAEMGDFILVKSKAALPLIVLLPHVGKLAFGMHGCPVD